MVYSIKNIVMNMVNMINHLIDLKYVLKNNYYINHLQEEC